MRSHGAIGFVLLAASATALAGDGIADTFTTLVSANGTIRAPDDVRGRWVHLGSWLVSDPQAPGYGFHDVYTQADAAAEFRRGGRFPDGTVLVKEIRAIGRQALSTGQADYASAIKLRFVMVKDAKRRFPGHRDWADGWGWALFDTKSPQANISQGYQVSCQNCHLPAKATDGVYLQAYPTLSAPGTETAGPGSTQRPPESAHK
ncbi:hypothetical protein BJL95_01990 [Methylomonas sp. LWB]|uniref:cytochrome P460 family protein n=1 Tax=Methylomonas sp. LWB TaxID=1905845 RepID=UPI0008D97DFF|nr:cytochrome P460 family protein [Methylomonas sp. LWB]OHX36675.1 hypothetical protein BJL95_01990 [Methylomonas sp. LWB]